jgi:LacI family transcriptional regulator
MVTIRMIAKECGCSTATVSKALNGAPDVSAETAERIRKTAAQMGYMPNAAARALKTSRSYNFGVLFEENTNSGLTHEFFSRILNAFKHRAEELGYDISFISDRLGGREISYTEHARYRNCDGVLILSADFTDPGIQELATSGIPMVSIDYHFENCGCVQSDNVQGMHDLVSYIYKMGHRKIAFIHGEETAVTRIRIASFYRTCRELGLEVPEEYVVGGLYHDSSASAAATRQLLTLKNKPTCIIYPDDISYIGGWNELEKQGLTIPKDICTAGYDGIHFSQLLRPKLTTLRQDADLMGSSAADELARAVEEGKLYIPGRILIPGNLLPGETVCQIK